MWNQQLQSTLQRATSCAFEPKATTVTCELTTPLRSNHSLLMQATWQAMFALSRPHWMPGRTARTTSFRDVNAPPCSRTTLQKGGISCCSALGTGWRASRSHYWNTHMSPRSFSLPSIDGWGAPFAQSRLSASWSEPRWWPLADRAHRSSQGHVQASMCGLILVTSLLHMPDEHFTHHWSMLRGAAQCRFALAPLALAGEYLRGTEADSVPITRATLPSQAAAHDSQPKNVQ